VQLLPESFIGAINWRAMNENVRRLQACIVTATQEQRWSKVKALQTSIDPFVAGKALATRRLTENQGKKTAPA